MTDGELTPEEQRLAQRLVEARNAIGYTQELVAEKLAIPRSAVSAIEAGKRKVSSIELKRLARLYRRPISDFLDEESESLSPASQETAALFRKYGALDDSSQKLVADMINKLNSVGRRPKNGDDDETSNSSTPRSGS